jgi:hypothetical protein
LHPGNGVLEYHESAYLCLDLKNLGSQPAENITVKLRSADQYITITDSVEVYDLIAPDTSKMIWNGFAVTVADNVPDNHIIEFKVAATDGVNEWISGFSLPAYAPVLQYAGFTVSDSAGNNNGKIDPGENVVLTVKATNTGNSQAYAVMGTLVPNNSYLTILSGPQVYGEIDSNQIISARFNAVAAAQVPAGQPVLIDFSMTAEHGITGSGNINIIIGQIPAVIVDMDPNHNSADSILKCMQNIGINAQIVTAFPTDLNIYSSVFVCLGTYSQNYKLTAPQGQQLADYLNTGGMLYMEGGDTWYYDTKTAVHPMFNIQGLADGTGNLNTIVGQSGSMGDGMTFVFNGENNYIDQLGAVSPAVVMFKNTNPVYGTVVENNAGTYRTVGSSLEFGGLANGTGICVRDTLLKKILTFFQVYIVPVELASLNAEVVEDIVKISGRQLQS